MTEIAGEAPSPADELPGKRRPTLADLPLVIEMIADKNISMRKACRKLGLHPGHTVMAIQGDNDLWAQYVRAREARGDAHVERVVEIANDVLKKKVSPEIGRVAMDGLKWAAGQMAPKADRLKIEHTGKDGEALPAAPAPVTFVAVYPGRREAE